VTTCISDVLLRHYSLPVVFLCNNVYVAVQVDVQCALVHSAMSAQKSTLSRSCQRKLENIWRKVRIVNCVVAFLETLEKSVIPGNVTGKVKEMSGNSLTQYIIELIRSVCVQF